jgi:mRNA-degrading endonuclease RelE of RelBE toxin-antitoxin system
LSLYSVEFDPRAAEEALRLPVRLRSRLKENLEFLRAGPFRSHPGVRVKEIRELRGVWRFHLDPRRRVFYTTLESVLVVVMVDVNAGITARTRAELRRRLIQERPRPH